MLTCLRNIVKGRLGIVTVEKKEHMHAIQVTRVFDKLACSDSPYPGIIYAQNMIQQGLTPIQSDLPNTWNKELGSTYV